MSTSCYIKFITSIAEKKSPGYASKNEMMEIE